MAQADLAYCPDGALAPLCPAPLCPAPLCPAASLARGPGQLGRDGAAGALLFDAGAAIFGLDLFAAFWRAEAAAMDWLSDFLCDPEMDVLIAALSNPAEDEEEEEILYSKRQLVTLGSEALEDY